MEQTIRKVDTAEVKEWRIASKTRAVKAKPLINLVVDKTVLSKFLVDTLEGHEPLGDGAVICIGEAGDVWQQMPNKLLEKYNVASIDDDGWMICDPRPDNAVDVIEVDSAQCDTDGSFYVIGQWGATIGDEKNVQVGTAGDFICRNRTDHTDAWIVRRNLFLNTYNIKS
ncbi:MAG: hypothetical protein KAI72_05675 [Candidatus Pacebacteria bacterium]|nr:hypothetical protein [Candidatus Paceibacterota bacterium]